MSLSPKNDIEFSDFLSLNSFISSTLIIKLCLLVINVRDDRKLYTFSVSNLLQQSFLVNFKSTIEKIFECNFTSSQIKVFIEKIKDARFLDGKCICFPKPYEAFADYVLRLERRKKIYRNAYERQKLKGKITSQAFLDKRKSEVKRSHLRKIVLDPLNFDKYNDQPWAFICNDFDEFTDEDKRLLKRSGLNIKD